MPLSLTSISSSGDGSPPLTALGCDPGACVRMRLFRWKNNAYSLSLQLSFQGPGERAAFGSHGLTEPFQGSPRICLDHWLGQVKPRPLLSAPSPSSSSAAPGPQTLPSRDVPGTLLHLCMDSDQPRPLFIYLKPFMQCFLSTRHRSGHFIGIYPSV